MPRAYTFFYTLFVGLASLFTLETHFKKVPFFPLSRVPVVLFNSVKNKSLVLLSNRVSQTNACTLDYFFRSLTFLLLVESFNDQVKRGKLGI